MRLPFWKTSKPQMELSRRASASPRSNMSELGRRRLQEPPSLFFAEILEEADRVKDVGPGFLQPAANGSWLDVGGVCDQGLCRTVLAHRLQVGLVERLSIPKEKRYTLGFGVVADDRILANEPHRAAMPYLGGRPRK